VCIKVGNNELGSVKALMAMSLNALIAEVFELDLDELDNYLSLTRDLGMDESKQEELNTMIAEYFDDLHVDFSQVDTLEQLFQSVVEIEFEELPETAFGM